MTGVWRRSVMKTVAIYWRSSMIATIVGPRLSPVSSQWSTGMTLWVIRHWLTRSWTAWCITPTRSFCRENRCGRMFHMCWSLSDGSSKLIPIDEESNHQIMHALRLGGTDGAAYQPFDPRPDAETATQVDKRSRLRLTI